MLTIQSHSRPHQASMMYPERGLTRILAVFAILRSGHTVGGITQYGVRDYCEGEIFQARCPPDQVILMQSAKLGRMRQGRCVKVDMGYLGCSADVLDIADTRCSGRRQCDIGVPDTTFEKKQPCLELKSYMEASYACVSVLPAASAECRRAKAIRVSAPSGYIASIVTQESHCGTSDTPWRIEALPGQRINITLWDFGVMRLDERFLPGYGASVENIEICQKYAVIQENMPQRSTVVCAGRHRTQEVYLSNSNVVQIALDSRNANPHHFLFRFEILGCPDPELAPNMWFKRDNNEIMIGCKTSDESWELTCVENTWQGEIGNCTKRATTRSSEMRATTGSVHRIVVATVCGVAFIVGVVVLLVGVYFYRRHRRRRTPDVERRPPATSPKTIEDHGDVPGNDFYLKPAGGGVDPRREKGGKSRSTKAHHSAAYHKSDQNGGGHHNKGKCDHSAAYQKGKIKNEYTHIWEMPLPIPGEM